MEVHLRVTLATRVFRLILGKIALKLIMLNNKSQAFFAKTNLFFQAVLLVVLAFFGWHYKDENLVFLSIVLIFCNVALGFFLRVTWLVLTAFVVGAVVMSSFAYNPYSHSLISQMEVLGLYRDSTKGDVYFVGSKDGDVVGVVFHDSNWVCYGKAYANKYACAHILSIIQTSQANQSKGLE